MKKIISLVLTLCLLVGATFALTSCEMFDTPETMVTKAVAKTAEQDSYEGKIVMNMTADAMGQKMEIGMNMDMKVENANTDDAKTAIEMEMSMLGETMNVTTYADKDWTYVVDENGEGYKQAIEEEDSDEMSKQMDSILKELPENLFEGVEIVQDGALRSVTIEIPGEVFSDIYEELVESVTESLGSMDIDLEITDAVVTITVKDGLIYLYDIEFVMSMSESGVTMSMDVEASVEFTKYGGVKVEFPEGYEDFPEME